MPGMAGMAGMAGGSWGGGCHWGSGSVLLLLVVGVGVGVAALLGLALGGLGLLGFLGLEPAVGGGLLVVLLVERHHLDLGDEAVGPAAVLEVDLVVVVGGGLGLLVGRQVVEVVLVADLLEGVLVVGLEADEGEEHELVDEARAAVVVGHALRVRDEVELVVLTRDSSASGTPCASA